VKLDTLEAAHLEAKRNGGAPGTDVRGHRRARSQRALAEFAAELRADTYRPRLCRRREIPKEGGKVRAISTPAVRDRVVQGALRLILEPIFEAHFSDSSSGACVRRSAHKTVERVRAGLRQRRHRVVDVDLLPYLDPSSHCTSI
jgi:RNA-directed DNA polymerase